MIRQDLKYLAKFSSYFQVFSTSFWYVSAFLKLSWTVKIRIRRYPNLTIGLHMKIQYFSPGFFQRQSFCYVCTWANLKQRGGQVGTNLRWDTFGTTRITEILLTTSCLRVSCSPLIFTTSYCFWIMHYHSHFCRKEPSNKVQNLTSWIWTINWCFGSCLSRR